MEFKVEILCKQGVYGYSHIETVQYEKNVGTNREIPSDRDAKIDEMLQFQCKLLQENLASIIAQCGGDKRKPELPPTPISVQVKLTSINYDQYSAVDACLHHSEKISSVTGNSFRNNGGHFDVMFIGNPQSLVDIIRSCVNLKVIGVQSSPNLIELSGQ